MRINFENDPETGEYYAVADDVVYNEQLVDSLWFAEICPIDNGYIVRWDDNFRNKIQFNTLELAKEHVLKEYFRHTPQIIGKRYDIN